MTTDHLEHINELIAQFLRILNKFAVLEKTPVDYGIDEKLFTSEIHMIEAIGKHADINVTELAGIMGVTKGAISQMVTKLMKKKLVKKIKGTRNDKEVILQLTSRGEAAFNGHENHHMEMYLDFIKLMDGMTESQISFTKEIFQRIEYYIDVYTQKYVTRGNPKSPKQRKVES